MHTKKENFIYMLVSRNKNDDNYISLSLFFSRLEKKKKKKKIECFKLFHWCMLRVERTVCCNQQTNIIISRIHIVHERETERERERRNLT
jgi:hypothetical protein